MSKRLDNIYCVTVAKYATMWIEAETEEAALKYAKKHCDEVDDEAFEDSDVQVDSWESGAYEASDEMKEIWIEDGKTLTYDEYMDELEAQEEVDKQQLNLFEDE